MERERGRGRESEIQMKMSIIIIFTPMYLTTQQSAHALEVDFLLLWYPRLIMIIQESHCTFDPAYRSITLDSIVWTYKKLIELSS